ncbi:DUF4381 domain-containing protein [Aliamphritea ceti]|uniref:DUF4381 domain-containing protein n=1 Tax=Aliamphritea ceti TaxID=1524258 RepID=UPI0021C40B65|nr:DUF4381 domain-containing protein [Aliamphritea ceti]
MNTNLSPDMQAQLDLLRDIALPPAVSWWPLAPGWWVLTGLMLTLLVVGLVCLLKRRNSVRYIALQELAILRKDAENIHPVVLATQLSVLLHRVAIAIDGKASGMLADANWSHYLSEGQQGMATEVAEFIASAPYRQIDHYQQTTDLPDAGILLSGTERWIRRHA